MFFASEIFETKRLVHEDEHILVTVKVADVHPLFDAHFAHFHILPGFMMIDLACSVIENFDAEANIMSLKKAKFLTPIEPGAELELSIVKKGKENSYDVLVNSGNKKVSSFNLRGLEIE